MSAPGPLFRLSRLGVFAALACAGLQAGPAHAAHPHALWRVVHDLCVPDRRLTGLSAPCVAVDLKAGYALVPDPTTFAQLLLVPTRRLTGIEDPALLQAGGVNYWRLAWASRARLSARLRVEAPREAIGLAINSMFGRSQDQLHIHISCVRPDVQRALAAAIPSLGESWSPIELDGRAWRVRLLAGQDLGDADPFKLLAAGSPAAAADMELQTLVVIAVRLTDGTPGFALLNRTADPQDGDYGHGEFLLDETCAAIRTPAS